MLPKPRDARDVEQAIAHIEHVARIHGRGARLPVHALVETHGALQDVRAIAALPRIESISFGLMDFVSAHRDAIPRSAMSGDGQFEHPLVVRAKLEIAAACHAAGKVPSHSVVTELWDARTIQAAATRAAREFGFLRMWSIHPAQIRPIVEAFAPTTAELDEAIEILLAAQAADWAPISHRDSLHDRASYRYFWQVVKRAQRTAQRVLFLLVGAVLVLIACGPQEPVVEANAADINANIADVGERFTLVEESVLRDAPAAGRALRDLKFPPDCAVSAVLRDDELLVPRGDTVLRPGDRVLALIRVSRLRGLAAVLGPAERVVP